MKKSLIFSILILLVAACTPAVSPDAVSPETRDLYVDSQSNRATAQALEQEAQLQEQYLTATAQAPIVHITETAAGVAIQQQMWTATAQSVNETQVAAVTQTAVSWTPTPNATSTAVFAILNAEGTQIANNVERDRLELERQTIMNDFNAKVSAYSWLVIVLMLILAAMLVVRRHRYQAAAVDARGNVLPVLDVVDGRFTDIDRSPNYQGMLSNNNAQRLLEAKLKLPQLPAVTAERQDATTERDQMTDLATRGLPADPGAKERRQLAGQQAMKQLSAPNMQSRFKILDPERSDLGVINGEITQVLDQEWKEASK